jgi:hypothetical protein
MMNRHMEWMLSVAPTLIGSILLIVSLFAAASPMLGGYLKIISVSSMASNFIRNSMEFMKYLVGPGG